VNNASSNDAMTLLREHARGVDQYLKNLRARFGKAPGALWDAIDYSLLAPGKRLRPALVLEMFGACGGADLLKAALPAAAAIELVHTFSLVHDDLPAMDDDDLRRGRATNHKVYGEAMAILAGDAMLALAFEILVRDAETTLSPLLVYELAGATGSEGMIGGQVLDIQNENQALSLEDLQNLHAMKTGALLTCACRMGAIAAHASDELLAAATQFGQHVGLAFQIMDDLLDATSTPQQLGKRTRKDAAKGKNTYPSLIGIDASRAELERRVNAAVDALAAFGSSAEGLAALARFVSQRVK
jgi:geranylgeranyl diphosphate synthase type II